MAGKKRIDELDSPAGTPDPTTEPPAVESAGPPPGDYCILVNQSKGPLSCPLRTGRNINLGPRVKGLNIHRSEPILKKDRTEILFTWNRLGKLGFENVQGGADA
jgi:hypothetical protein